MKCDKCGQEVPTSNDAVVVYSFYVNNPAVIFFNRARHFLPTETCEGSPSRAQYIEGQPRDTRGYPYIKEDEAKWREAYRMTQRYAEIKTNKFLELVSPTEDKS